MLRRYLAQVVVGVLGLGLMGYAYSDLFWRAQKLSLEEDVAYMHSFDGQQQVYRRDPELPALALDISLKKLAPKIDPGVYCWINRNYIVHWRAIRELMPEENGRRLEIWLDPPNYSILRPDTESCTYVRKERVDEVVAWYQACLARETNNPRDQ